MDSSKINEGRKSILGKITEDEILEICPDRLVLLAPNRTHKGLSKIESILSSTQSMLKKLLDLI